MRKILVEKGWACSVNGEDIRHDLTEKALGYAESSKNLTNSEFNKVLAKFWSVSMPAELNERLHELDQATTRFLYQAYHLINRTGEVGERNKVSYFEALCNRTTGCANPARINKGQRRAVIATIGEIKHCANRLRHQAEEMTRRAVQIAKVYHRFL